MILQIASILEIDRDYPLQFYSSDESTPKSKVDVWDFSQLEVVLLCLITTTLFSPRLVGTSITQVGWNPWSSSGPVGKIAREERFTNRHQRRTLGDSDVESIHSLYRSITQLNGSARKSILLVLRRFKLALERDDILDTALDIGIVLELLFTSNKPLDSSISYALRLRASRLLRGSLSERKKVAKKIRELYDLRSKAAHTGYLSEDPKKLAKETELIEFGKKLAAEAIQHRIFNPNVSADWSEVDFG